MGFSSRTKTRLIPGTSLPLTPPGLRAARSRRAPPRALQPGTTETRLPRCAPQPGRTEPSTEPGTRLCRSGCRRQSSRGCPEGGAICPAQFAPEFARAATPWSEVCPQCFVVSSKSRSKHASWLVSPGSWTTGSLCVTTQERTGVRYLWGERRERMLEERVCASLYWSMVQCQ